MTSRWIKPAGPATAPRHLVTVVVQGRPADATRPERSSEEVWDSACVCYSVFRDGKWRPERTLVPATGAELIDVVHGLAKLRTRTAVVCPVASYSLTLAGMFRRWWEEGAQWNRRSRSAPEGASSAPPDRHSALNGPVAPGSPPCDPSSASGIPIVSTCILRGNPDIVRYVLDGQSYTWSSGHNWFPCTEEGLAETMRFTWTNPGEKWRGNHPPRRTPRDRALLWLRAMQRLCDWWRHIDGGPWGWTIGSLAMKYFRHRLQPKTVLAHQVEPARELEEKAVFGGRCQTFCLAPFGPAGLRSEDGKAPPPKCDYPRLAGPLEHWDVAGMYPTILATEEFPTQIWRVREPSSVHQVETDLAHFAVIADVMIETDSADYPVHDEDRVIWPVGRFRTSLAGPELARAVRAGHVRYVFRSVAYSKGRPFARAARTLLQLRQESKLTGDTAWEMLVKSLSVAFAGKLAQIKHDWIAAPKIGPLAAWGEFDRRDPVTRQMKRYRAAGPLVWQQEPHKHKGRPLASCFCYLTAYGRDLLWQLMKAIPADQLVSVDTDGLWVARPTGELFRKCVDLAAVGGYTLKRTAISPAGQWYGPRHYWTSKGWILSGYHEPRRLARDLTFRDSFSVIPSASVEEGPPKRVRVSYRTTKLTTLLSDDPVSPNGWLRPRRLTAALPPRLESAPPDHAGTLPGPQSVPSIPSPAVRGYGARPVPPAGPQPAASPPPVPPGPPASPSPAPRPKRSSGKCPRPSTPGGPSGRRLGYGRSTPDGTGPTRTES